MTTNIQFSSLTQAFDLSTIGTADFLTEIDATTTTYEWTTLAGHTFLATGSMFYQPRTGGVEPILSKVNTLELNLDGDPFAEITVTFDDPPSLAPLIGSNGVFWSTVLGGRTIVDGGFSAAVTFAGDLPTLFAGDTLIGGKDTLDFSDALQGVTLSGDVLTLAGTLIGGADTIIGSAYDDMLYGERQSVSGGTSVSGRDRIEGGAGDDQIFGQTGGDTLLGGAGSDTIKGGKGNDFIDGGADHDILFGNLGNDTFLVSDGLDEIDGGDGTDALDFSNVLAGIVGSAATVSFYDMSQPPGVFDPLISWGDPVEKLEDVTSVEKYIFGNFGGTVTVHGNSDDEIFVTRDSVTGSRLVGMAGNDTFRGGALLGDTVDYGLEADEAGVLSLPGGNPRGALGIVADLKKGRAIDFFGDRDTLIGIEKVTGALYYYDGVVGSNRGETITNAEFVQAGGGDDIVEVNASAYGTQGLLNIPNRLSNLAPRGDRDDGFFDGGAGIDTLVMTEGSFYVDLGKGRLMFGYSGPVAAGVLEVKAKNFENVTSLGTIIGSAKDNILIGGTTNDDLRGRRGNDTLDGGDGADSIDGGRGIDTLTFGPVTTAVTVSLADGTGSGNRAEGDTYANIENIIGTHGDDTLTGDDGDNVIDGERGKDVLDGGDHGAKGDTVSYRSSPYSVTVDLAAGTVDVALPSSVPFDWNDTITGFENVIGSMEALDILIGDGGANKLQGLDGNDDLRGMGGDDLLIGGRGDDTLTGGTGGDTFLFRRGDGNDTITDFEASEDHIKIRGAHDLADLTFTASGGDVEISFRNITITVETVTIAEIQDADIFGF